ncbi:hypothetical protein C0J52_28237 [Blattella germanica]|nr:hypothetical protein C0J52_28237 [Blattella germanica]
MIGSIVNNEADVGISATTQTKSRMDVLDFLTPILDGRVELCLQKSQTDLITSGSSFSKPFSWTFWIAVVTSLLLFSISLWFTCILAKLYGYQKYPEYTLLDALHIILGSYCGQGW